MNVWQQQNNCLLEYFQIFIRLKESENEEKKKIRKN